jgi:hypothetical protein
MKRVPIGSKDYQDLLDAMTRVEIEHARERAGSLGFSRWSGDCYAPVKPVAIEIGQGVGQPRRLVVKPLDLTKHGLGCLIGLFLHDRLPCTVHLVTGDGEYMTVQGTTAECVFLGDRAHFLSVRFARALDLDLFVRGGEPVSPASKECAPEPASGDATVAGGGEGAAAEAARPDEPPRSYGIDSLMEIIPASSETPLAADIVRTFDEARRALAGDEGYLSLRDMTTPDRMAVIAPTGPVLAVNPAWLINAYEMRYSGPAFTETNYIEVLERHRGTCKTIPLVLGALRELTSGESVEYRYAYACEERDRTTWYMLRYQAQRRRGEDVVVIAHQPIASGEIEGFAGAA